MNRLFTNARLVVPDMRELKPGSLLVQGDLISDLNPVTDSEETDKIDCQENILAPGIVDLGVFAIDKPAFHFGGNKVRTGFTNGRRYCLDRVEMVLRSDQFFVPFGDRR